MWGEPHPVELEPLEAVGGPKANVPHARSLAMSIALTVADILKDHVTLEVESIDRLYLNAYVPQLQSEGGVVGFFRRHRGAPFASSALMAPISTAFVGSIERFVNEQRIPLVTFQKPKKQRKDAVAAKYLAQFPAREGVFLVGKAQEKISTFRTQKRRNPETGKTYPWIYRTTAMVNQYYFYILDEDFGPLFIKFASYFPYQAKVCLNGHEYVKRQLRKAGIGFEALDNGILSCADPARLRAICDSLTPQKIDRIFRKWLRRLPHPFTARDRAAGYRYDLSILQMECSLTQVLDRPQTGRLFFEEVIRENLDIGRPDHVQLLFARRITKRTPGRFRTRVITDGVIPSLHVDYKDCRIKQYLKAVQAGCALRTETTINNAYDFAIGRRLHNLPALRAIGFQANRQLLAIERLSHDCLIGEATFTALTRPTVVHGQRLPALRFADPRVMALFDALVVFRLSPAGFTNRTLREHLAPLLGLVPASMTAGAMTYDLRRLRLHGLITRVPHTHRYTVTPEGLRIAVFFRAVYARTLRPGLALTLAPTTAPSTTPLRAAFDKLDDVIDRWCHRVGNAA